MAYSFWIFKVLEKGTRENPMKLRDMRFLMAFLKEDGFLKEDERGVEE